MKDKRKSNPFMRIFVFMVTLIVLVIIAGIVFYMYYFHIPEPEGLSLASWPETFTGNFSYWLIDNEEGNITIKDSGLKKLDEYGLWIQIIDEKGYEVLSYNKPEVYPANYTSSELISIRTNGFENGYTVFASSFETSDGTWNYFIGFPYAIGKYMLYYNGAVIGRIRPLFRIVIFSIACMIVLAFFVYMVWITKHLSRITKGIGAISGRSYTPIKEKGLFTDIYAALNKLDVEIRQSDKIQSDTDRARNDWIANITHDLKTPLSPIKGYAELLVDHPETESQCVQEYGSIILKNISHTEKLMNDLKLTYQLDSGSVPFHPHEVCFIRYIRELVIDIVNDPAFTARDIRFESDVPEFKVTIAPDLFRRAVQNLIINALVHNPSDTKVTISISSELKNRACVFVCDNGLGMSEEEQSELFSRYYRGTNMKEKSEGSGLGLAIAKQIVMLHGGDITVKSKPGYGTEFAIVIPLESKQPS